MSMGKPSEKEEEFFARQEFERRRREAEERQSRQHEEERGRLKALHWMRCPKCGMELVEMEFKGLKIDKCSACEGIWLDPGEMDSLIKKEGNSLLRFFR